VLHSTHLFGGELFYGSKVGIRYRGNLRDIAGNPAYAAASIAARLIVLDPSLKKSPREHRRILFHEYFHFAWVRLGNPRRRAWEAHLESEWKSRGRGEAGWSAEWRKQKLSADDVAKRSRRWRDYCCESFCDTAAWIIGGVDSEVTLARTRRRARLAWFKANFRDHLFPI
jgi:hypothetical protein